MRASAGELAVAEPFEGGYAALGRAGRARGRRRSYVLKVPLSGRRVKPRARRARAVGRRWRRAPARARRSRPRALLLERLQPGTSLLELGRPRGSPRDGLRRAPPALAPAEAGHPFATAQACAADWAGRHRAHVPHASAQPFDAALLRAAVAAFELLAGYDGESRTPAPGFPPRQRRCARSASRGSRSTPSRSSASAAFDARWLLYDLLAPNRAARRARRLLERLTAELWLDPERVRLWSSRAPSRTRSGATRAARRGRGLALAAALV